jgi:FKBP-type peptidyl-prolyl cis-trans isomerase FklB
MRKYYLSVFFSIFLLCMLHAQNYSKVKIDNHLDSVSYIIGADFGLNLLKQNVEVNPEALIKGLMDGYKNEKIISEEQSKEVMTKFQMEYQKKQEKINAEKSTVNRIKGDQFLAENRKKEGVVELPSGLQYKVVRQGEGSKPEPTDEVTVHYTGTLIDGTKFDSSKDRGQPATFLLNQVIKGWVEGLQLMKEGSVYILYIPPDLAYGDKDNPSIPPGSTLIFEVELIKIKK